VQEEYKEIRCKKCNDRVCDIDGDKIKLKYKGLVMICNAKGAVIYCPNCSEIVKI
jgi:phage FluMu protein Com